MQSYDSKKIEWKIFDKNNIINYISALVIDKIKIANKKYEDKAQNIIKECLYK